MKQTALPGITVLPKLTERQELALTLLKEHGPLGARAWGALVHEAQGRHPASKPCRFDESAGVALGKALRAKGLVKRRVKNTAAMPSGWVAVDAKGKPLRRATVAEDDIPF